MLDQIHVPKRQERKYFFEMLQYHFWKSQSEISMLGYGIAVSHSVVRGVHEYRVFPNRLAQLELLFDLDSTLSWRLLRR